MHFGGRWVPMEVMNTIFLLWALAVLIVGVAIFWFVRSGRSSRTHQNTPPGTARGKRSKRKRRG